MTDEFIVSELSRRRTGRWMAESFLQRAQGQCFELLLRERADPSWTTIATVAGSALYTIPRGVWCRALQRLAQWRGGSEDLELLQIASFNDRPLVWRKPTAESHWASFVELRLALDTLSPAASKYGVTMERLRHGLVTARSVEAWRALSAERLLHVTQLMTEVFQWAIVSVGASQLRSAILLSGSSSRSLGLVSDIDFIPVWQSAPQDKDVGREFLERFVVGVNACGAKAENLVAILSRCAQVAFTPAEDGDWDEIPDRRWLASALAAAAVGKFLGDESTAVAYRETLVGEAYWPPRRMCLRRWGLWWDELEQSIALAPPMPFPLLVPLYLRKATVLLEITERPFSQLGIEASCLVRLRDEMAWLRDVVCVAVHRRRDEREESYLERVATAMGHPSATAFERHWHELLGELDTVARYILTAAGVLSPHGRTRLDLLGEVLISAVRQRGRILRPEAARTTLLRTFQIPSRNDQHRSDLESRSGTS